MPIHLLWLLRAAAGVNKEASAYTNVICIYSIFLKAKVPLQLIILDQF